MSITEELEHNFRRFCIEYSAIPVPSDKALVRQAKDSAPNCVAKVENTPQLRMKFLTNFLRLQGEIQSWKLANSAGLECNRGNPDPGAELGQVVTPGTIR
jgi:hypothetical protein